MKFVPFCALLAACTSVPARTALQGDLPALKASISEAERQGRLGSARVKELAGAVLERELSSAASQSKAVAQDSFPDVSACAPEIRPVLEVVANGASEYSAPAALALIDAGYAAPRAAGPASAAVQAREAVGPRAGERRRALFLHGDATVRRGALGGALEGASQADAADVAALTEAARLDPDPEARRLAIRALGRIGKTASVQALDDVYASALPEDRREIALAWSLPASFAAGGGAELEALAHDGEEPVLAALALVAQPDSAALGSATLVRAMGSETAEQRLDAIAAAPWSDAAVREAIGSARQHKDPATRVLALWRFVEAGVADAAVTHELEQLATDKTTAVGVVARAALASAGRVEVKAALREDLEARTADRRMLAALALLELKDWPGAAQALADDSPRVRRAVACQVLSGRVAAGQGGRPSVVAGAPPVVPLLLAASTG